MGLRAAAPSLIPYTTLLPSSIFQVMSSKLHASGVGRREDLVDGDRQAGVLRLQLSHRSAACFFAPDVTLARSDSVSGSLTSSAAVTLQFPDRAKAAEMLGDRWTLLIVRELMFGPIRFNEFERGLPGISRSVLTDRLKRLQRNGIIETGPDGKGYCFTEAGESLRPVVRSLGEWVGEWAISDPQAAELDPDLLMMYMSRHINQDKLPQGKTVLEFEFVDASQRYWLTLEPHGVSVCVEDPCLPVAVSVRSTISEMYRVYMGRTTLGSALEGGTVTLDGLPADRRLFAELMHWSHFAPSVRRGIARAAVN